MSSFTEKLEVTQLSISPRRWRLEKSFRYYIGAKGSDKWIDALSGFVYDGGSIPRFAWFIDAPMGDGAQAYCIHDLTYACEAAPRSDCDDWMLEGLQVLGLNWCRRNIIYSTVRTLAAPVWWNHTPGTIIAARQFIRTSWELPPIREFPPEVLHAT